MEPKEPGKKPVGKQADIEAARTRAQAYTRQSGEGEPDVTAAAPAPKHPRSDSEWSDVVNQAIEEAMRKGQFDNLRGRGKPLPRNENPFTPPGSELAFDILKNNDLTLGWIGARNEVQQDIERWRARLRTDARRIAIGWDAGGAAPHAADVRAAQRAIQLHWESTRPGRRASMEALNRHIRDVNLQQSVSSLHLIMLRLAEEERRAGVPHALL